MMQFGRFHRTLSVLMLFVCLFSAVGASAELRELPYNYTYFTCQEGGFVFPLPSDTTFEPVSEWLMAQNIIIVGGTRSYTVIVRRYPNMTYDKMCARLLSNAGYKCKAYSTNSTPRMVATALDPNPDLASTMVCLEGQDGATYVIELLSGYNGEVGKDAKMWDVAHEITYCIALGYTEQGAKIKITQ